MGSKGGPVQVDVSTSLEEQLQGFFGSHDPKGRIDPWVFLHMLRVMVISSIPTLTRCHDWT